MSFCKITEDSLGSQNTIAASSLREAVSNKMILCFPERYRWLEEVENDRGATWWHRKGRKGFLEEMTSKVRPEVKESFQIKLPCRHGGGKSVRNEMERDEQEPYKTCLHSDLYFKSSVGNFSKIILPSCKKLGQNRASLCGECEGGQRGWWWHCSCSLGLSWCCLDLVEGCPQWVVRVKEVKWTSLGMGEERQRR